MYRLSLGTASTAVAKKGKGGVAAAKIARSSQSQTFIVLITLMEDVSTIWWQSQARISRVQSAFDQPCPTRGDRPHKKT
jgi:hypothetical protein